MGRNKTPTNVLEMRGSFNKNPQRARPDEPAAVGEVGAAPDHFTESQKAAWDDIVDLCHIGVLCRADRLAVEIAAVLLDEFRKNPVDMPAAKLTRLDSILSRFGMTPADRPKVAGPKKPHENPFNAFFNNGQRQNG